MNSLWTFEHLVCVNQYPSLLVYKTALPLSSNHINLIVDKNRKVWIMQLEYTRKRTRRRNRTRCDRTFAWHYKNTKDWRHVFMYYDRPQKRHSAINDQTRDHNPILFYVPVLFDLCLFMSLWQQKANFCFPKETDNKVYLILSYLILSYLIFSCLYQCLSAVSAEHALGVGVKIR